MAAGCKFMKTYLQRSGCMSPRDLAINDEVMRRSQTALGMARLRRVRHAGAGRMAAS